MFFFEGVRSTVSVFIMFEKRALNSLHKVRQKHKEKPKLGVPAPLRGLAAPYLCSWQQKMDPGFNCDHFKFLLHEAM